VYLHSLSCTKELSVYLHVARELSICWHVSRAELVSSFSSLVLKAVRVSACAERESSACVSFVSRFRELIMR
jgi:hypothetical protein